MQCSCKVKCPTAAFIWDICKNNVFFNSQNIQYILMMHLALILLKVLRKLCAPCKTIDHRTRHKRSKGRLENKLPLGMFWIKLEKENIYFLLNNHFNIARSMVFIHNTLILVCKHGQHLSAILPKEDSYTNIVYFPVSCFFPL